MSGGKGPAEGLHAPSPTEALDAEVAEALARAGDERQRELIRQAAALAREWLAPPRGPTG